MLAMAAEPTTPLGVIARIEIGTWTLFNETDPFIRRQSALSFLQKMPDIISRAVSGGYTYHEIGVMEKFGVSLNKPVYHGMAPPTKEALANALATHKENCNDKKYLVAAAKITDSDYVDSIVNESDLALPPPGDIEETKKYIAVSPTNSQIVELNNSNNLLLDPYNTNNILASSRCGHRSHPLT